MLRCLGRKRACLLHAARHNACSMRLSQDAAAQKSFANEIATTDVENIRNIGVSAHIDSGKTTVTERILYYTGRIDSIHDVKGKDGVGAKMDSMELERQRGITIKSAAASMNWKGHHINLIDTPGHIDFTVEVERALRVLDGAILVLCASSGVQTQTYTVYKQMQRYGVPFISFVNKMDRLGADAHRTLQEMKKKMGLNAAFLYTPIGSEKTFEGLVDVLGERCVYFEGNSGDQVVYKDLPTSFEGELISRREDLVESLSNVDEEIGERYLMEEDISREDIEQAIKRTVLAQTFTPVISGSALKNKGVQPLLDCVTKYLPNPTEVENYALQAEGSDKVLMDPRRAADKTAVALAFKLEQNQFGQLTYMRIYQGCFKRGNNMVNVRTGEKMRIPRLVLMHSNEYQDVTEAYAGDIVGMIGVDCASGDTFIDAKATSHVSMESMFVPEPVISMTIKNNRSKDETNFSKALNRFQKEDPTFRSKFNPENKQIVISGMGELQLDIYAERMRREYNCDVELGVPTVNYRETLTKPVDFTVQYKRQSGGRGQYALAEGRIEPLPDTVANLEYVNAVTGGSIPQNYIKSLRKGVQEALLEGALTGHVIAGIKFTVTGGKTHQVDSSDWAFSRAGYFAIKEFFVKEAMVMEPWMEIEITAPDGSSGAVLQSMTKRRGIVKSLDIKEGICTVYARAPLQGMFGYTTELRSITQGTGLFTMEFSAYEAVEEDDQAQMIAEYRESKAYKNQGTSENV